MCVESRSRLGKLDFCKVAKLTSWEIQDSLGGRERTLETQTVFMK